jgi:hypothetical protein
VTNNYNVGPRLFIAQLEGSERYEIDPMGLKGSGRAMKDGRVYGGIGEHDETEAIINDIVIQKENST